MSIHMDVVSDMTIARWKEHLPGLTSVSIVSWPFALLRMFSNFGRVYGSLIRLSNLYIYTIKHTEDSVSPNDERLLLAKAWLEADEGAHTLFDLWGQANTVSVVVNMISNCHTDLVNSDKRIFCR